MEPFFRNYMTVWGLLCLAAIFLMIRYRRSMSLFQSRYWRYLFHPWKTATFLTAATGLIVLAPYTGDPTWDYTDAAFMSILTFATAPWVMGTAYLRLRGSATFAQIYVALCLWLFSVSWSYDLYILLRDGAYPYTWQPNIMAGTGLYVPAGLLWNLEWRSGRGVVFGFMEPDWPDPSHGGGLRKIVWFALPLMAAAAAIIAAFFV